LTYGIFGNAVRVLPPLVISNELLPEGLQDFAEALHKFA
jgi:4-aminobutyrate aminotransferase-like enzyme